MQTAITLHIRDKGPREIAFAGLSIHGLTGRGLVTRRPDPIRPPAKLLTDFLERTAR